MSLCHALSPATGTLLSCLILQFRKIPLKPETQKEFLRQEISDIKAALSEVEAEEDTPEQAGYRAGRARGKGIPKA